MKKLPDSASSGVDARTDTRPAALVAGAMLLAVLLVPWLPNIDLDTGFADATVWLTNTAGGVGLVPVVALGVILIVTRPDARTRRTREVVALGVVLATVLGGGALANEFLIKPAFGIPRPNIDQLAEDGVLGPEIDEGMDFYAAGNKRERRRLLAGQLTADTVPYLSDAVRAHWIHEAGHSFPSGHATASMTFATVLALAGTVRLAGWRRWLALGVVPFWAVAVVYTRPLLEVHRPVDVIAGTLSGIVLGLAAFVVVQRFAPEARPSAAAVGELTVP